MSFQVSVSAEADRQIRQISRWYRDQSGSVNVARQWHDGILQAIQSLSEDPQRLALARESDAFPFELRELLYGSGKKRTHRILFRIMGDVVQVLFVRHRAQEDIQPDDIGKPAE